MSARFNYLQVQLNISECQDELDTLSKVDNKIRKYSLLRAGLELIQLVKQNKDFDVYNTKIWIYDEEQFISYRLGFYKKNEKELELHNKIIKLTTIERKLFLRNVVLHAGRKLIKDFNPASDIVIYENQSTSAPVHNSKVENNTDSQSQDNKVTISDVSF